MMRGFQLRDLDKPKGKGKSKNYAKATISTDVFEDSPSNRLKLDLCHQRLLELIDNDPALPPKPAAKP